MARHIAARSTARAPARMRFELDPDDVFYRAADARASRDDDDDANRVRVEVHFSGHRSTLDANCDAVRATIARVARGHVWARDAPRVAPIAGSNACEWSVWVGDDVDDAWLAAACALETSSERADVARAVRVWDDDGEFTLIETAEALPAWVTPERATGTTFLVKGELVVRDGGATERAGGGANARARTNAALETLDDAERMPEEAQKILRARTDAATRKAKENRHDAFAIMPRRVARVLRREPQLVAAAIESLRARDPAGVRAAAKMTHFEPVDFHPTLVRMSRWLFSEISRERFEAPERYPMPPKSADDFIARELGMKIACGFEMLLADRGPVVDASASDAEPVDDRAWTTFKASLTENGYFRNEMVGSAMYRTLLANAVREYNASPQASTSRRAQRSAPAERVREILAAPESDDDALRAASPSDASDETWLLEADKALNEELAKLEKERERTVCDATRSARSFVERESGFEGVETRSRRVNHSAAPGACPGDLNIPDGDAGFSLDARKFLSELGKALAIEDDDKLRRYLDADGADFDSDDSDDDFNFPDDSDSDAARRRARDSDDLPEDDFFASSSDSLDADSTDFVHVGDDAPDSDDDDDDDAFAAHYDAVLRQQLASTDLDVAPSDATDADVSAALARGFLHSASADASRAGPAASLLAAAGVPADVARALHLHRPDAP